MSGSADAVSPGGGTGSTGGGAGNGTGLIQRLRERLQGGGGSSGRALARGAIWSIGLNVAGAVLALGAQILFARTMPKSEYGVYIYILAWLQVALLVGRLEIDTAAIRFVSAYAGGSDWARLRGFLRRSHQVVLASTVTVAALAALGVAIFPDRLQGGRTPYLLACILLPLTALLMLEIASLQGLQKVRHALAPNLVVRPGVLALSALLATFVFGLQLDASGAIVCNILGTVAALALAGRFLLRARPPELARAAPAHETRLWIGTAAGLFGIAGAQLVLGQQVDVLVVGTLLGPSEAASYGVAGQLASLISFGATAVVFVALPMVSDLYAQKRTGELQRIVAYTELAMTAVSVPVAVGLVLFGPFFLGLFGSAFVDGYPVLLVLAVGQTLGAILGILAGFLMTMTGHQNKAGVIIVVSALFNLALTLLLTPRYGMIGAALATTAANIVKITLQAVYVWRHLGIRMLSFGRHLG